MEMASPWQLPSAIRVSRHPRWMGCNFFSLSFPTFFFFFPAGARSPQVWHGALYKDHQALGESKQSSMRQRH